MDLQFGFCTSADGTRIAYATLGSGARLPIVCVSTWGSSKELEWERPEFREFHSELAQDRLVVQYDRRGVAASQRDVEDVSLEADIRDLSAVVDHLKLERFHLMGVYDGGAIAVAYTARNPERVGRIVLRGAAARGIETAAGTIGDSLIEVVGSNWSLARRLMASASAPDGPLERQRWISELLREAISPEMVIRHIRSNQDIDLSGLLAEVTASVLVIHLRSEQNVRQRVSRELASLLPHGSWVVSDGFGISAEEGKRAREFLDEETAPPVVTRPLRTGTLVTILFTDLVSSTALTQRLGDAGAQELVHAHNTVVREALSAHSGNEIKHTGDGIMASFTSAAAALECAAAIQRGVQARNDEALSVYVGLNAGEPIAEDQDLFGTAVQLARRICDHAEAGEVLVSNVVRELAAGKDFLFADRGETPLRGFEDPVRLYELRWRD